MRRLAPALIVLAVVVAGRAEAADDPAEIGTTVVVKNQVTAELDSATRKLGRGDKVHRNEFLVTGKSATAEVRLIDDTKLALGPESRVALDNYVIASSETGSIAVTLAKGAFRFITGKTDSKAYQIKTPAASIGVRGTVFDVYVADNGEIAVLLHDGAVDICPTPSSCRRHDSVGRFVHVTLRGLLSDPLKWDGTFFKGIAITHAFPFVGRTLAIDPVRRLRHAELIVRGPLNQATRGITKPVESLSKVPRSIERAMPKPRLPF